METKITHHEQNTVVAISGEIDMHKASPLRKTLLDELSKKPKKLVINLKEVSFIDSSGVATLVEALKECKRLNSTLVLCEMNEKVKDVFELARLEKVFTIVAKQDEA